MSSTPIEGSVGLTRLLRDASLSQLISTAFALLLIRWVAKVIYRVYFHPLTRFPGPKLAAATRIPQLYSILIGSSHDRLCKLHQQYGDVVRVSPDEISFIGPQAWRDIHGHGSKGTPGSVPEKHWDRYGKSVNGGVSLINAQDADHTRMRRIFTSAFSDRALKQQEPLFMKYVNQLVHNIKDGAQEDPNRKWDMVRLFNFTTFDIMGDLTFGEPLHMLSNAEYDPWVSLIFGSIKFGTRLSIMNFYPALRKIFKVFVPESFAKKRYEHFQFSVKRVTKRLEKGRDSEGVDLWDLVLGQEEGKGLTRDEMDSNSSLFMIAGTETTATLLSGLTYILLRNPECMKEVVKEVREAFASGEDMHMENLAALPYMNACIKEAFRLYPPVAIGLPRLTPPNGSTICGEFVPPGTTVTVPHLAMYTSERNFKDPYKYAPERWLGDEKYENDHRAVLQPFSVGSRDCLGKNMAYHEMRLILAKILYNFDFELCLESEGWIDHQETYNLWEKQPLMCRLKPVA
ncbi:cytochrome P450 [Corynespora cassiicola Philippines]|uniref:Cytochrome P450 n=1 Tax=Corynespora cassiicola Philippines TaxID=1448308 RepID=A0A2T2NMQ7_CORCC|nr:cytochrome P450 [Corynespora cassiicola Philippines]